jgi:hypothetical protein
MTRLPWALALSGVACLHPGARESTFDRWFGCPAEQRFATVYENLREGRTERSETVARCEALPAEAGPGRWAVETVESGDRGDPRGQRITYAVGPGGMGMVQARAYGCTFDYDPPLTVLPAVLTRPSQWTRQYERLEGAVRGTCRLEPATPYCERGVAVTCRTTQGAGDLVERSHYCPRVGWQGREGAIFAHGAVVVRYRSYGELGHGDPPDQARPYPTLGEIEHPEPPPAAGAPPTCFTPPPACGGRCP